MSGPGSALRRAVAALTLAASAGLALVPAVASAASYVVAPTGSDGASGSAQAPWRTLQRAADAVHAGDLVTVKAGTYRGFSLGWDGPQNGTQAAPIVFHAEAGVVIDQSNAHTQDGIDLEGTSFITVEGFEVKGVGRAGIRAVSDGSHNSDGVVIRDNDCHDNGRWGIFTSHADHLVISGNRASRSVKEHGIYVSNGCISPTVSGNRLWGNHGAGLHMNGDASQGGTGLIVGAKVERNVIWDNGLGGGSAINCDGVQQSRIENNLVYAAHASGISLFRIDAAGPARDNVIVCNTILVAGDGRWALNVKNGSTGNVAYDNILLSDHPTRGSIDLDADSVPGFRSDYNVVGDRFTADDDHVVGLAAWRAATGQDAHSVAATQAMLFVGGGDYHLAPGSPALAKGTAMLAPPADLDGKPRPAGAIDVGAYQRTTASGGDDGGAIPDGGGALPDAGVLPDAGDGGDGGGDAAAPGGGCGCALGATRGRPSPGAIGAALLLLAAAAARRRGRAAGRRLRA